jgi:hypothetical protein
MVNNTLWLHTFIFCRFTCVLRCNRRWSIKKWGPPFPTRWSMSVTYLCCFLRCWEFMSKKPSVHLRSLYRLADKDEFIDFICECNKSSPKFISISSLKEFSFYGTFLADTTYKAAYYLSTTKCPGKRTVWKIVPKLILSVGIWCRHNSSSTP